MQGVLKRRDRYGYSLSGIDFVEHGMTKFPDDFHQEDRET